MFLFNEIFESINALYNQELKEQGGGLEQAKGNTNDTQPINSQSKEGNKDAAISQNSNIVKDENVRVAEPSKSPEAEKASDVQNKYMLVDKSENGGKLNNVHKIANEKGLGIYIQRKNDSQAILTLPNNENDLNAINDIVDSNLGRENVVVITNDDVDVDLKKEGGFVEVVSSNDTNSGVTPADFQRGSEIQQKENFGNTVEQDSWKSSEVDGLFEKGGNVSTTEGEPIKVEKEAGEYAVGKIKFLNKKLYEQKIIEIFENGEIATKSEYARTAKGLKEHVKSMETMTETEYNNLINKSIEDVSNN